MKKYRLLLIILAAVMVFAGGGLLSACDDPNVGTDKIDLKKFWEGNQDEDVYTVTEQNDKLTLEYAKTNIWQYAKRSLATEEPEDLKNMKTLVMKAKMVTDSNDPAITLKFEMTGGLVKEVTFGMSDQIVTYEWNLSETKLDQAIVMYIMVEGPRNVANGTLTIEELYLTKDAINEANNVEKTQSVTEEVNEISADSLTANLGWYDGGDSVYTVTKDGSEFNVEYNKKAYEYASVKAYVKGIALREMFSFRITVKGTAGKKIIVKPFDKVEKTFTFTGGNDTFIVDLSNVTDVVYTEKLPILIMAEGGVKDVTGSFRIISAEFSRDSAPIETVVNNITATEKGVNAGWYDGGDAVYNVTKSGAIHQVTYTKGTGNSYSSLKAYVKGAAIGDMKTFKIVMKGTAGKSIIIKPFNQAELNVTFTGANDIFYVDLAAVTDVDFTAQQEIILMAEGGSESVTGTFEIISAEFSSDPIPVNSIDLLNKTFESSDAEVYTTEKVGETLKVTYSKGEKEWPSFHTSLADLTLTGMKRLIVELKVTATAGNPTLLLKLVGEGSVVLEGNLTATGEIARYEWDLSEFAALAECNEFLIFADPGAKNSAGTIVIETLKFDDKDVDEQYNITPKVSTYPGYDASFSVNNYWRDAGDKKWTVEKSAAGFKLNYPAGNNWSQAKTAVDAVSATFNRLIMKVKGPAGEKAIIKIGTVEYKFETGSGADQHGEFTGEIQDVILALPDGVTGKFEIIIFAGLSDSCIAGSIEITEAKLMQVTAVTRDFNVGNLVNAANGNRFTVTAANDGYNINYTTNSWDTLVMYADLGEGGYASFDMIIRGQQGHTAIINVGGAEQKFENAGVFTGEDQNVSINTSALTGIVEIRLFFDWDAWTDIATVSGHVFIVSAGFTVAAQA